MSSTALLVVGLGGLGAFGCGGSSATGTVPVTLHAEISAPMLGRSPLVISSISLHFLDVTALVDSGNGPRLDGLDVSLDTPADATLGDLSRGWYSGVGLRLGNLNEFGITIDAHWRNKSLRVQAPGGAVALVCPTPVKASNRPLVLTVATNPSRWFDGVNLDTATDDGDDSGLTLSLDDNSDMAAQIVSNVIASLNARCGD